MAGEALTLVSLRSIGSLRSQRRKKKEERRMVGGTPARPNKFRKRKRFASKPFKFATFVSPLPKKFAAQFKFATFVSPLPKKFAAQCFSGTPVSLRSNCHIERERNIFIMRVSVTINSAFRIPYSELSRLCLACHSER